MRTGNKKSSSIWNPTIANIVTGLAAGVALANLLLPDDNNRVLGPEERAHRDSFIMWATSGSIVATTFTGNLLYQTFSDTNRGEQSYKDWTIAIAAPVIMGLSSWGCAQGMQYLNQ